MPNIPPPPPLPHSVLSPTHVYALLVIELLQIPKKEKKSTYVK
jgi:hypothetical protein